MSLNVGNLVATLGLDSKGFSTGIATAQAQTGAFASGFASKMSALAAPIAAVGAAVAAIGTASVLAADKVDQAYATIRVGTGATGEALDGLKDDFDSVFKTVPNDAADVATAIADLNTRLGLTGQPLQDLATQFLNLSRITGTDVATNIKEITRLFGDWNIATEDQSSTLNYLFKTSQSTGIGVDKLATLTTQYGTSLRGLGFNFEDSVAMLGKFEKEGVNIETTMSGLKVGLANLSKSGLTDSTEAWQAFLDRVKAAPSDLQAVSIAAEVFGSKSAADMALAIREGRLDLGDFVSTLQDSQETITAAADDSMTLGDRFGILQNKATEALTPVGDLLVGAMEEAMPYLSAGIDRVSELGQGFADWLSSAQENSAPFVSSLREGLAPAVEFFQEKLAYLSDWWQENSPVFIAAWQNIAAAIQWVIEQVIVPVIEWAWPYIETIISGALDVILNVAKLFASILAGDWQSAGDALVDISKGTMELLNGIMAAGWDAIATGIEWVGNGIQGFIYVMMANIVQYVEDQVNKVIDILNGMISSIESVTSAVGITLPRLSHISLNADKIVAPTLKIARWSETAAGQAISAYTAKDEPSGTTGSSGNEEDIDAEFEDREQDGSSLLDQVATTPNVVVSSPESAPAAVEVPAVTLPETPAATTATEAAATTAAATTIEGPIDVDVINWPEIPTLVTPLPVTLANWSEMPTITLPEIALPEVVTAQATTATTDIFPRLRDYLNAYTGETRVVVELDGAVVGEALVRRAKLGGVSI